MIRDCDETIISLTCYTILYYKTKLKSYVTLLVLFFTCHTNIHFVQQPVILIVDVSSQKTSFHYNFRFYQLFIYAIK